MKRTEECKYIKAKLEEHMLRFLKPGAQNELTNKIGYDIINKVLKSQFTQVKLFTDTKISSFFYITHLIFLL